MRETLKDTIRSLTKEKSEKSPEWHGLRGRVTLSYAVAKSGLDERTFAREYLYKGRTDSGLMEKWLSNEAALNRISAERLNKRLPGTIEIFHLPLFELLADKPMSAPRVRTLMEPYRATKAGSAPFIFRRFSNQAERIAGRNYVPVLVERDTHTAYTDNELYSFVSILSVVRLADAVGDSELHCKASKYLFRALPSVLKLSFFREHVESLIQQLEVVRSRMQFSALMFDVDWDVIWRQIDEPDHQSNRLKRRRDPMSGKFVDIEDPIMEAQVMRGAEVRSMEKVTAVRLNDICQA